MASIEIEKIRHATRSVIDLFNSRKACSIKSKICVFDITNSYEITLYEFCEECIFLEWSGRDYCSSIANYLKKRKLTDVSYVNIRTDGKYFEYLAFVYSMIKLVEISDLAYVDDRVVKAIIRTILDLIQKYNKTLIAHNDVYTIVQSSAEVDIANSVMVSEKNEFDMYSYLISTTNRKRLAVLKDLANLFEEKRKIFKGTEFNKMQDDLFKLLNFYIRHSDLTKKSTLESMSAVEKENIYDSIFSLMTALLCAEKYLSNKEKISLYIK